MRGGDLEDRRAPLPLACLALQHACGCDHYAHREREYAGEQQNLPQDSNRHCSLPVYAPNALHYRG